eukprot:m.49547 g.49547  ORF g.49547 m.49547 type:complete len:347 (-) comp15330_c0_seq1:437-1477(-)
MMDENELPCPWTPNSGMKSFGAAAEDFIGIDCLLDAAASPMKIVESTLDEFRSPVRAHKRSKLAPPSPATAMILQAARVIEEEQNRLSPGSSNIFGNLASPNTARFLESAPGTFSPPSPARTPSRLLFSPKSEPRTLVRAATTGISPRSAMLTTYDGMLIDAQGNDLIGSIWKHSEENKRKTAKSTARRPLLQQTPSAPKSDDLLDDLIPLPDKTPNMKQSKSSRDKRESRDAKSLPRVATQRDVFAVGDFNVGNTQPRSAAEGERKKDRKVYSTAGRPRQRGEYKCGKCGFYPKKEKHDCDEERQKLEKAGLHVEPQQDESRGHPRPDVDTVWRGQNSNSPVPIS